MSRFRRGVLALVAALGVGMPAQLRAEEARGASAPGDSAVKPKPPSPASVLQKALGTLARVKSYRTSVSIQGGFASRPDHEVTEVTVRESYRGEVFGDLMASTSPRTFRTPKKGAALISGGWRDILSDQSTVKMTRLFAFPRELLEKALLHSQRGARWLDEPPSAPAPAAPPAAAKTPEKDAAPAKSGKTVVVQRDKGAEKPAVPATLPRTLRVELPPGEALTQLLTVQSSNCFGGG